MPFSVLILVAVFVLIAVRQLAPVRLPIWGIMSAGAVLVILSGDITPVAALTAIDGDVMVFLFGMFVLGEALERSGLLFYLAHRVLHGARSTDALIARLLLGAGLASALLMNDTLAVIGTPLVLLLAREHRLSPQLLLLTLAFAVTIGSVMSPIGNPQNLLIALHGGMASPFVSFLQFLAIPTLLNLAAAFVLLRWRFRAEFHAVPLVHTRPAISDHALARLASIGMGVLIMLIVTRLLLTRLDTPVDLPLAWIALASALPVLIFSSERTRVLRRIDWHTLIFFAAMFVLMASVWASGFFQALMTRNGMDVTDTPTILGVSVLLSQLISNVPMVALYLPLLELAGGGEAALLALAAGSTLAGNLLLLGAASNIIIVQNAERRAGVTIGFLEFARIGVPLTIVNVAICWLFLPG